VGTAVPFEPVLGMLSQFKFSEDSDGLILTPTWPSLSSVTFVMALNNLDHIGPIIVQPIDAVSVPRHAGRRVPGGALWQEQILEPGDRRLRRVVLANETSVTTIDSYDANDDRVEAIARALRVELTRV
jgi:hypothetical protein